MLTWFINILLLFSTSSDSFSEKLNEYLSSKLSDFEKWNYEIISQNKNYFENLSSIAIDQQREFKRIDSYGYIPIKIYTSQRKYYSSFLTVKLSLYNTVLQASRKIQNNSRLINEDFENVQVDVSSLKGIPFNKNTEISNYRSKMEIRSGAVLLESMIEKLSEVKTGDEVTAYLNNGAVSISFLATAKNDGKIGDEIRIVSKDNKLFEARVIASGNVIIVE
jgi:flagellar basal body P-ring formation protein FlgA